MSYFLDDIDRISDLDYMPSNKDVLMCRSATKGVYEFTIRIHVSQRQRFVIICFHLDSMSCDTALSLVAIIDL